VEVLLPASLLYIGSTAKIYFIALQSSG